MYACVFVPQLPTQGRSALLLCAESFSPNVEEGENRVTFDIRGLGTLIGNPGKIAEKIIAASELAGLRGNLAIASSPHAASAAAEGFPGVTIIQPGDEARALATLPLTLLRPDPEILDTFHAWGLYTFGDLSRLPEEGLAERMGPEGVRLHTLSRGLSPRPLVPGQELQDFESSLDLDNGLESLEPLAFLLGRLLNEICGSLLSHGLAATAITIRLDLEDLTNHQRTISLPYATTDSTSLLKLLQYDLAAHPPQSPILKVSLHAQPSPQRRLQGGLFIPLAPEAEKLELTLARLAAVVGEGNVGSPELLNTHRPDSFRLNRFTARADRLPLPSVCAVPPLAIRLYRPPLPAEVEAKLGYPQRIRAKGIAGNVVGFAGPWRTSGDWWRPDPWSRDEWDVALQCGSLYRISREVYTRPAQLKGPDRPPPSPERYAQTAPPPDVIKPRIAPMPAAGPEPLPIPERSPGSKAVASVATARWFVNGAYD